MADNRQFTDHNEIGGVNVYLEDKKLAESPEQNTVASTDYVLLKDEDNIPRKISKANLMSVVKDAIGELLKSNDLGTSVTNVPALNASAFGSATVANLASVLGVWPDVTTQAINQINANTLHLQGVNFYNFNNITLDNNFPETNYGCSLLTIFKNTSVGFQICYMYSKKIYFRGLWSADENQWGTWKEL